MQVSNPAPSSRRTLVREESANLRVRVGFERNSLDLGSERGIRAGFIWHVLTRSGHRNSARGEHRGRCFRLSSPVADRVLVDEPIDRVDLDTKGLAPEPDRFEVPLGDVTPSRPRRDSECIGRLRERDEPTSDGGSHDMTSRILGGSP